MDLSFLKRFQNLEITKRPITRRPTVDNYHQISVYPSASELYCSSHPNLPKNITKGPYINVMHYLYTHFALLREDFIKPIRQDVQTFLKKPEEKLFKITIHTVTFTRKGVIKGDLGYCLEIKKGVSYSSRNVKVNDKRFMLGSLLIFSTDNFQTILCGRVADNNNIKTKRLLVSFESHTKLQCGREYTMIECNDYFEPYYHVLKVIQKVRTTKLPMQEYLIDASDVVERPKYFGGIPFKVLNPQLNKSQLNALNGALAQELVIVQGPPGTGKTFLGLKIAKQLLSFSKKWFKASPMLIISVTNHALDQFLEGLVDATPDILRCGAQSKSSKMKNYTIQERRRHFYETRMGCMCKYAINDAYKEYADIRNRIINVCDQLDDISTNDPTCIFNLNILAQRVFDIPMWFQRDETDEMVRWLLENDDEDSHFSFDISEIYEDHLNHTKKGSSYHLLSVSMMQHAIKKLEDHIMKVTKRIEEDNIDLLLPKSDKVWMIALRNAELESCNQKKEYLLRKLTYLKTCLSTDFGNLRSNKYTHHDLFDIPIKKRWQLYKQWLSKYEIYLKQKLDDLLDEYMPIYEEFDEISGKSNLTVMRHQKVIGMTTTMAARMHQTIRALKCPIVIVEEAAQALEAHVIPVLTEHCQHLILLGDHKQLRPATADYEIEKMHQLGVSLFERMVKNNIQCHTLNVQHRMRPEISSLITPSIYPVLHDHDSVKNFGAVRGMDKCVYFIDHRELEKKSGDCSKKNVYEAKFLIQLAVYLLKNCYAPEEITILAAYSGQVDALTLEQRQQSYVKVKSVLITTVDNFQGEENKIILLSLVRNNPKNKAGFLTTENRVCVALSRAKEGLYIMGNMGLLAGRSELWIKIKDSLLTQNAVGSALFVKCQRHSQVTKIQSPEDFESMCPAGGCAEVCGARLASYHGCVKQCHNDDIEHDFGCKKGPLVTMPD